MPLEFDTQGYPATPEGGCRQSQPQWWIITLCRKMVKEPGRAGPMRPCGRFPEKARTIEEALREDICIEMGEDFDPRRFVPYVMMHEFEGLLFSDPERLGEGIGRPGLTPAFEAIRKQFSTPEEINDSPQTAPSKRILSLVPEYEKPLMGTLAVLEIGLDTIRQECPTISCLGRTSGAVACWLIALKLQFEARLPLQLRIFNDRFGQVVLIAVTACSEVQRSHG